MDDCSVPCAYGTADSVEDPKRTADGRHEKHNYTPAYHRCVISSITVVGYTSELVCMVVSDKKIFMFSSTWNQLMASNMHQVVMIVMI